MTAIHSQAPHGDWRRVSHRLRRVGRLVERALTAVHDRRRRQCDRLQITAVNARNTRDIEIRHGDPLDLEQRERDAWLYTLGFPPF